MGTRHNDQLALAHFALIDMERVQKSIGYLLATDEQDLKAALFRDAVISYAKPFSSNRYSDGTGGLRISQNHVPKELLGYHKELLALRDELIAHTDMATQKPQIDKHCDELGHNYSMTVVGYSRLHKDHLIDPLLKLAKAIHSSLINNRSGQTKNDF